LQERQILGIDRRKARFGAGAWMTRGLSSGERCTTVAPAFIAPKKATG
jgi:hypothetical protein